MIAIFFFLKISWIQKNKEIAYPNLSSLIESAPHACNISPMPSVSFDDVGIFLKNANADEKFISLPPCLSKDSQPFSLDQPNDLGETWSPLRCRRAF